MFGRVSRKLVAVHAEEVRWIDHGRDYVSVVRHANDVLSGVSEIHVTLPCHHSEDIERNQNSHRMKLRVSAVEEIGNDIGALPPGMGSFECELRVLLVAFGGEAH